MAAERVVATDGVRLAVEAHGDGPPILFSCGYCTTRENFRPQVAPLVAAGFRVLLWDYRGHGESDAPEQAHAYSMAQVLDDLSCVLDWGAGVGGAAVLAGFSFGGLASLHFALRQPGRVRALMLLDTGPGFKNPEAQARWRAQTEKTAAILEQRGFDGFLASRGADTAVGRHREAPAAIAAAAAIARQRVHGVAQFGRQVSGLAPSCIDELAQIEAPSLVLVGAEDTAFLRAAEVLAARLPHARHVVIPDAGHVTTLEQPEAVTQALLDFLLPPAPQQERGRRQERGRVGFVNFSVSPRWRLEAEGPRRRPVNSEPGPDVAFGPGVGFCRNRTDRGGFLGRWRSR
ncbi:MAG: alpha/beta hydrolase [Myxococcota bacterium]|nr:alpha/beta hydrolase [Myxococcota bacterium]